MGSLASIVERKGSKTDIGEVVPIPILKTDRKTGVSTTDNWAAFEAAYKEDTASCEVALARGYLPNPEKPKDEKEVKAALADYRDGKIGIVDLTRKRFEAFAAADKEAFEAYLDKLKKKYRALEKEDLKKRPLTALAYA